MRLTLVRHSTVLVEMAGHRLIVDPMLDPPNARGPVRGTPNGVPNPLVPLPMPIEEVIAGVDAVLLTHTHEDHIDAAGVLGLPRPLPWFCQPEDLADLQPVGLTDMRPLAVGGPVEWEGITITRTGGRHGREEAAIAGLGPVSGFVLTAAGEPTVYIAGDTVWCPEVEAAIAAHAPGVIVVNAGGARFLQGGTITMEAGDVVATAQAAPDAVVVPTHVEAINHCLETRADLRAGVDAAGVGERVRILADGESLEACTPARDRSGLLAGGPTLRGAGSAARPAPPGPSRRRPRRRRTPPA
ncbi:MAG: MBL fold metallo-hydrolase [Miltoncostaeaceae bacterium]